VTKSELQALAAFDRDSVRELAHYYAATIVASDKYNLDDRESTLRLGYLDGRETQSARLQPLIQALIEDREALRVTLGYYAHPDGDDNGEAQAAMLASSARMERLRGGET